MIKTFPKLYATSSTGKTKEWEIRVEDNQTFTTHGYIDGKKQIDVQVVEGKNIGKSNETTPFEQACSDAESKWKKKQDKGYRTKADIENNITSSALLPMLAMDYKKRGHNIVYPCYVQPKLDGVRCIADKQDIIIYNSRQGKDYGPVVADEFDKELNILMKYIKNPDGELYTPDLTFQEITSAIKKKRELTKEIKYYIYDQVSDDDFEQRHIKLVRAFEQYNFKKLVLVPTFLVENEEQMKAKHLEFVEAGFEGTIIRNAKGKYILEHRSKDLQKYKDFMDAEFVIVGFKQGTGREEGTIIFRCNVRDYGDFDVRPKGTREDRQRWFRDGEHIVGKKLTVKFQGYSDSGIPRFPVGVAIRDYE